MIYAAEFTGFIKVGKSRDIVARLDQLYAQYGKSPKDFVVEDVPDHVEALAHEKLRDYALGNEKFSCDLQTAHEAILSTSATMEVVGAVRNIPVEVDRQTGYINVTRFLRAHTHETKKRICMKQFVSSNSVRDLSETLEDINGRPSYFNTFGAGAEVFAHPMIFIELCRHLSVQFRVAAYRWLFAHPEFMVDSGRVLEVIKETEE